MPILLALVLFLWTPPHFWSLATLLQEDYRAAGIPMLPVVVGEDAAARAIFAHTLALVLLSFLPLAFGMGPIYLAGAALGGGLFLWRSYQLMRRPGAKAASACFHASLIQLTLLLSGAIADPWLTA